MLKVWSLGLDPQGLGLRVQAIGFNETLYFLNVLGFSGWVGIIRSRTCKLD